MLTATDSGDAGIKATAAVTVQVQSSPTSVSILGGDRMVPQGQPLQVQVNPPPPFPGNTALTLLGKMSTLASSEQAYSTVPYQRALIQHGGPNSALTVMTRKKCACPQLLSADGPAIPTPASHTSKST